MDRATRKIHQKIRRARTCREAVAIADKAGIKVHEEDCDPDGITVVFPDVPAIAGRSFDVVGEHSRRVNTFRNDGSDFPAVRVHAGLIAEES
jgi:hypothetical protein